MGYRLDTEAPSSIGTPTPSRSTTRLYLRRALFVVAPIWAVSVAALLLLGFREVRAGEAHLAGLKRTTNAESLLDGRQIDTLRASSDAFERAHRRVDNLVTAPVKLIPVLGRQFRSVSALTLAAAESTQVVLEASERTRGAVGRGAGDAEARLMLVRDMADISEDAHSRLSRVDLGPSDALIGPLNEARARAEGELAELNALLQRVTDFARGMESFLKGPRRYLVIAANNAEMRAGSGMFLSWGTLDLSDGKFRVGKLARPPKRLAAGVAMDPDFQDRWAWAAPNREWRNLGMSPRFDATAELAARMWKESKNETVDGILAIDVRALRAVLTATGPVEVDGRSIGAKEVQREILHDQYVGSTDAEFNNQARREFIASVASSAIGLLNEGDWDAVTLVKELASAARGRHLLAWSRLSEEQKAWEAAGMAGEISSDSMMLAVLNRGQSKLDQFLKVSAEVFVEDREERKDVRVKVRLTNTVVPAREPVYITGLDPPKGIGRGVYGGILALTLPGQTAAARIDGVETLAVSGPDGPSVVVGAEIQVAPGETQEFVFRFRLPPTLEKLRVEPSARIPPIEWAGNGANWRDSLPRDLRL